MYDSLKSAISRLWWQLHCWRPGKMPGTLIWVWNAWGIHQLSLIIISLCYFLNLKRSHWQLFLKPMSIIIVSCSYLIFFSTYHGLSKKTFTSPSIWVFSRHFFGPSPQAESEPRSFGSGLDGRPMILMILKCPPSYSNDILWHSWKFTIVAFTHGNNEISH